MRRCPRGMAARALAAPGLGEHREGGSLRAALDGVVAASATALVAWTLFAEPTDHAGERTGLAAIVLLGLAAIVVLGLVARHLVYARHLSAVAQRLSMDATRDSLTGLANRRSFLAALETAVAGLPAEDVAVVLLDLDGFKELNDTFGHAAGDRSLTDFADRLVEVEDDTVLAARLNGDEFGLLLVGCDAESRARGAAQRLTGGHRSQLGPASATIGASAGLAVSRPGDTASGVLRRADLALHAAKRTVRSRVVAFCDDMAARAERRHLLAQALPGAAARGELSLVYQPLIRLEDGSVAGAEALLRWSSPLHGQVPPLEFVPLAEETGVIADVGAWVLDRAARDVAGWAAAGRPLPRLFVNVSPRQLTETFADAALGVVRRHGVDPSVVTVEITESAMPGLQADRCLARLREGGFSLAMDDFGAGFSSLAQLAALPVDTLKFDREFIRGVCTPDGRRIVDALIALAGDLGLTTVAEGVELPAEADVVRQAGCALGQGYHFAHPLTAAQLGKLLAPAGLQLPAPREPELDARDGVRS